MLNAIVIVTKFENFNYYGLNWLYFMTFQHFAVYETFSKPSFRLGRLPRWGTICGRGPEGQRWSHVLDPSLISN